jgi:hypothetical protein
MSASIEDCMALKQVRNYITNATHLRVPRRAALAEGMAAI